MIIDRLKIAEFPVTEWQGVRFRLSVNHPDTSQSMSYEMVADHRLMPIRKIRRPVGDDQSSMYEFAQALRERDECIRRLAGDIAAAMIHAMQRIDEQK